MINLKGQEPLSEAEIFGRLLREEVEGFIPGFNINKVAKWDLDDVANLPELDTLAATVYESIEQQARFVWCPFADEADYFTDLYQGGYYPLDADTYLAVLNYASGCTPDDDSSDPEMWQDCDYDPGIGKAYLDNLWRLSALLADDKQRWEPPIKLLVLHIVPNTDSGGISWELTTILQGYEKAGSSVVGYSALAAETSVYMNHLLPEEVFDTTPLELKKSIEDAFAQAQDEGILKGVKLVVA